jgi:hypothetical protein
LVNVHGFELFLHFLGVGELGKLLGSGEINIFEVILSGSPPMFHRHRCTGKRSAFGSLADIDMFVESCRHKFPEACGAWASVIGLWLGFNFEVVEWVLFFNFGMEVYHGFLGLETLLFLVEVVC